MGLFGVKSIMISILVLVISVLILFGVYIFVFCVILFNVGEIIRVNDSKEFFIFKIIFFLFFRFFWNVRLVIYIRDIVFDIVSGVIKIVIEKILGENVIFRIDVVRMSEKCSSIFVLL